MKTHLRSVAWLLAPLVGIAPAVHAQESGGASASSAAQMGPPATAARLGEPTPAHAPRLSEAELDQLTAPIALYPDELLAQVLMASTYPLEVAEAAIWLQDDGHARLSAEQLTTELNQQPWDPSVKALVPFQDVLQNMAHDLEWTRRLGEAVIAQRPDVMDSVQRLRRIAKENGKLQSSKELAVDQQGNTIVIAPAEPTVVYVPYYDPSIMYGVWPWSAYPPYFFPVPVGVSVGFGVGFGGFAFGGGVPVGFPFWPFWGWCGFNWQQRVIVVDVHHVERIDTFHRQNWTPQWTHQASPVLRSPSQPLRSVTGATPPSRMLAPQGRTITPQGRTLTPQGRLATPQRPTTVTPRAPSAVQPITPSPSTPSAVHPIAPSPAAPPSVQPITPSPAAPPAMHPVAPIAPPAVHPISPGGGFHGGGMHFGGVGGGMHFGHR